jgi:hypothetical protein
MFVFEHLREFGTEFEKYLGYDSLVVWGRLKG